MGEEGGNSWWNKPKKKVKPKVDPWGKAPSKYIEDHEGRPSHKPKAQYDKEVAAYNKAKISAYDKESKSDRYAGASFLGKKTSSRLHEKDTGRLQNRKSHATGKVWAALGKKWEGNEWMKKALDTAWEKDQSGFRSGYTTLVGSKTTYQSGDAGGRKTSAGGYTGWHSADVNRFAHTMTGAAEKIKRSEERAKETEKILEDKTKRSGMGSRSSTVLTGGHEGVLGKARTRRETLLGQEDKERGFMGKAKGSRKRKRQVMGV